MGVRSLPRQELRVGRGLCQRQEYYPDRYGRPGIPPRPSGIKSADGGGGGDGDGRPTRERLLFGALSTAMTGTRAIGYYCEYIRYVRGNAR